MHTRRSFLRNSLAASLFTPLAGCAANRDPETSRVYGIALAGLGSYSKNQLGPALLNHARNCRLTGLITGSPDKVPAWREKYGVAAENVCDYDEIEQLKDNDDIDIVYVVTPHGLHYEHTMAAIAAGKHVIVEKPMAGTEAECTEMIEAAKAAGVTLHVGYRLHHDPYHLAARKAAAEKELGEVTAIDGALAYYDPTPRATAWQIDKKLSVAGALYSTGVYPVQGAFYLSDETPSRILSAKVLPGDPDYYKEVPGGYEWVMEYPSGKKATGHASSIDRHNFLAASCQQGDMRITSAYSYNGLGGHIGDRKLDFPKNNQQATHMDAICVAIEAGVPSRTPGEMGRRDVIVLEAIMKSAETGEPVDLKFI